MVVPLVVILITLLFSAFFSGMEIAFVSSNKLKLEIEKKQSKVFTYVANLFTRNPGNYITTILVGNNIALVIYSMQMAIVIRIILSNIGLHWGNTVLLETIVSTIIVIFVGEFIPKAVVRRNPNFYFKTFSVPVYVCYIIFYPISWLATNLSRLILRIFGLKLQKDKETITFDRIDLANLLDDASEAGDSHNNENEIKYFQNALEFPEVKVRDCMVPRVDIYAVEVSEEIEELKKMVVDTRFSRLLIYDGTLDNIIGYVNSKSLFKHPKTIRESLREIIYVPESMEVDKLLTTFIKKQQSIAVVIDEFGGTAGMITLEDILEEIFGEIEDEHDSQEMIEKITGDGQYILSTRLEIEYLNDKYDMGIPESDDYDTLAGYIIFVNKGLPKQGEVVEVDNKIIRILRMSSSKIDLVKMEVK